MIEKKVLIADYDANSLDFLIKIIEPLNVQVVKASDGKEAYEKFKEEKPDLVILEAMLPKLHGFDLCLKIFQETKGTIPVIIVSGLYRGPHYRNEALFSFKASDYFEKPLDKKRFIESVSNLLYEEAEIEEKLPSPDEVIERLTNMLSSQGSPLKGKK